MSAAGSAAGVHEARPWPRALLWLAVLGPLFFLSYGAANWLASRRAGVGSLVFDWEHAIPFWPWTILPYWSIDLLYALSLFVCTTRRELDAHGRRLLTAQLVAVSAFVLVPLRFTFERPPVDGLPGALYALLGSFDLPYNQAPSLHIALLLILWVRFDAHTGRRWR
ncbi:MAG TPA: serine/threonine protein phosphatase, partial [Plasticicumulans sp.]|nr:serine/threonine protein phosphatase [Plasticicumulans sp.]